MESSGRQAWKPTIHFNRLQLYIGQLKPIVRFHKTNRSFDLRQWRHTPKKHFNPTKFVQSGAWIKRLQLHTRLHNTLSLIQAQNRTRNGTVSEHKKNHCTYTQCRFPLTLPTFEVVRQRLGNTDRKVSVAASILHAVSLSSDTTHLHGCLSEARVQRSQGFNTRYPSYTQCALSFNTSHFRGSASKARVQRSQGFFTRFSYSLRKFH